MLIVFQVCKNMESNSENKISKNGNNYDVKKSNKITKCLRMNLLTILTIFSVILGVIVGVILREVKEDGYTQREIMYVSFIGDIFLRVLKSLILPLIISSLISAIANLDVGLSGKIASKAIFYYLATTVSAIILGIILAISIKPGESAEKGMETTETETRNVTIVDTLLDLVRSMFPPNLVEATIFTERTLLIPNGSDDIYSWKVTSEVTSGMNILGLVVFSAIFGITLAKLGQQVSTLTNFFNHLMLAMMKITTGVIWLSPVGILFLVTAKIMEVDDFGKMVGQLGLYFATVLVGVLVHGFIILPIIYTVCTRQLPFKYVINMAQALATAFGTSSSSATLPVTIQCLEDRNGIDPRVSRFVLPIGATINMDGTALYEAVAAIFIAQYREIELGVGDYIAISLTATAASIGAAGIPQAGLVTMVMVLDAIGLPADDVTLILAVDWLLDRFRTTINVLGDAFGAGIVNHLSKNELNQLENTNDEDIP